MKFVYTTQNANFRKDCVYENPRYFEKLPPQGLGQYEEVILVGHWPLVEAALEVADIKFRHADKDDDLGDGLETVAREAGTTTSDYMKGTEQVIEIPGNWEDLDWQDLRTLAGHFSKDTIVKKDQAIAAIREELDRRG